MATLGSVLSVLCTARHGQVREITHGASDRVLIPRIHGVNPTAVTGGALQRCRPTAHMVRLGTYILLHQNKDLIIIFNLLPH